MRLNLSKEWFERNIDMIEELEADNADELTEAMKEGFATRLANAEDKADRYRAALEFCKVMIEKNATASNVRSVIVEALK